MIPLSANVVICGAGMAGIAAAYHLTVVWGISEVVLIDERIPLSLTSDKGTMAYRNWWPGPDDTMVRFMSRSIDLLEDMAFQSDNYFQLNRRGYVFLTADEARVPLLRQSALEVSALGAGPLRVHPGETPYRPAPSEGYEDMPTGADLLLDNEQIRRQFPFVRRDVAAMLHVRRAGWMDAPRLGQWMLEQAQAVGLRLLRDRIIAVDGGSSVRSVRLISGAQIDTNTFVIAAGPYLKQAGALLGLDLPVVNELHGKLTFEDYRGVVPRDVPLMIWNDPLSLPWSEEQQQRLAQDPAARPLLEVLPAGVHFRTRGDTGNTVLVIIWAYDSQQQAPIWPPRFDPHFGEVLLRGLSAMIPGLSVYFGQANRGRVDGGYYCKTPENRPLIGPLPVEGAYVIGALSGYGIMAAPAAGELLAAHIVGQKLPGYAADFLLSRYDDPDYLSRLAGWDSDAGQL